MDKELQNRVGTGKKKVIWIFSNIELSKCPDMRRGRFTKGKDNFKVLILTNEDWKSSPCHRDFGVELQGKEQVQFCRSRVLCFPGEMGRW